ncbi:hypothetical protein KPH14_012472 [Odynerus spinipes]|uniref:Strictosidine synthase conserved region domain-containing protein n=1 Tax=Odynerus spinipes TaxID=1348599 RepID=A0AAD9RI54_9HYME|nr:hypothetical protein KPH14_012472 [Odynerus spinipes]
MGYLKSIGTAFIYISLTLALITFLPGLPPDVPFSEYSITPPTQLKGKLASNDRLNGAELFHVGKLKGPECFASYNGQLYTSIHGGYVIKIDEKEFKPFVKFGKDCDGIWQEQKCGRPLGLKFDKNGNLYVVDSYYGIFKVDPSGKYKKIIDTSKPIAGKVPQIPNSLDIADNGDIFWTDSSTDFALYDGLYTSLADPSGRLLRYNAATKTNEVLVENLAFANGVLLSKDESFVIVLETFASRIIKYNLKGAKAGQKEIFSEGLPGLPDNVHSDNHGGFLVSLVNYADEEHPALPQTLMPHPYIRKMIVRLLMLVEAPFKLLQNAYPNFYTEIIIHAIGSFETMRFLSTPKSVVLQYDATGKIVDATYATDEKVDSVSSAFIHKDYLWLGSPFAEYVARVPLKQAFPHLAQAEKLKHGSSVHNTKEHPKKHSTTESQTVKTTTAAPTSTTTAKPVTTTTKSTEATTTTTTTTTTSTKTTQKTATTQKKVVTPVTTTTKKPSTVPKITPPKTTATPQTTTTTAKPPTPNVETISKPPANKEIKYKNVEQVKSQQKPPIDSSKQNVKTEEKVTATTSNVKTENNRKTTSKPETNKPKVQNTQSNTPKPVQKQGSQSGESPKK